jgi:hypothetical protein
MALALLSCLTLIVAAVLGLRGAVRLIRQGTDSFVGIVLIPFGLMMLAVGLFFAWEAFQDPSRFAIGADQVTFEAGLPVSQTTIRYEDLEQLRTIRRFRGQGGTSRVFEMRSGEIRKMVIPNRVFEVIARKAQAAGVVVP